MSIRMKGWMKGRMNEWMDDWMHEWMTELVNGWMNVPMNEYRNESMNELVSKCTKAWTNEWKNEWKNKGRDGSRNVRMKKNKLINQFNYSFGMKYFPSFPTCWRVSAKVLARSCSWKILLGRTFMTYSYRTVRGASLRQLSVLHTWFW